MWIFQAPNGRILKAGPSNMIHWIDIEGDGRYEPAILRDEEWGDAMMNGNAILYDVGKILCVGGAVDFDGGVTANQQSYVVDMNGDIPISTRSGDMAFKRTYADSVILPSGDVVVIGGMNKAIIFNETDAVLEAELWNPNTGQWTVLERMRVPRM